MPYLQIPAPKASVEEEAAAEEGPAVEPLASPTADDKKLAVSTGDSSSEAASSLPELLKVRRCFSRLFLTVISCRPPWRKLHTLVLWCFVRTQAHSPAQPQSITVCVSAPLRPLRNLDFNRALRAPQTMAKTGGKMVPDADQMKQILAGIAGQLDQQTTPSLLSLSVRSRFEHRDATRDVGRPELHAAHRLEALITKG